MIYIIIFLLKILENALSTLRLIIVANGKKFLGAILQFIIVIIWIYTANSVLGDIKDDFIKVIAFSSGALVGSYIGSIIEEKLALGSNLLIISSKCKNINDIIKNPIKINNSTFISIIKRKKRKETVMKIKKCDDSSRIIACNAREYTRL